MTEYVAVVYEIADVRSAEIRSHCHTRVRTSARPERHLDRVIELLLCGGDRHTVHSEQQEVNLMEVEFVIFHRTVLNGPILDGTLRCRNGRWIIGIKQSRCRSVYGDEEIRRTRVWIARVNQHLREVEGARSCGGNACQPRETIPGDFGGSGFGNRQGRSYCTRFDDRQRPRRVVIPIRSGGNIECLEDRLLDARGRRRDDEFRAAGGGNQYIGL